jgi:hypothetical protein
MPWIDDQAFPAGCSLVGGYSLPCPEGGNSASCGAGFTALNVRLFEPADHSGLPIEKDHIGGCFFRQDRGVAVGHLHRGIDFILGGQNIEFQGVVLDDMRGDFEAQHG